MLYFVEKKNKISNQMYRLISINRKIVSVKLVVLSLNLEFKYIIILNN